jgi:ribonuclease HII
MSPVLIHDELILGIDEAGRGPILGPMVMACVGLRPRRAAVLTRAGVTDSKQFAGPDAHAARLSLVPRILDACDHFEITVVDVAEIDRRCRYNGLNRLEQERAARLIARAPTARRIVCDGARLFSPLRARWAQLEALDHGESQHAAVAAASILAKVRRDELYAKICARYAPEFGALVERGGGYMNGATRAFLRAYIERNGCPPPEGRRSWPWDFAADLLGEAFDRWADVPDDAVQLGLFSTPSPQPCRPSAGAADPRRSSTGRASLSSPPGAAELP